MSTARPRVYVTRRIAQSAIDMLAARFDVGLWDSEEKAVPRDVLLREAAQSDGLLAQLSDRIDAELLDAAPRCRIVANMAVGYDNADVLAMRARDVLLTNTPDVLTETTADVAWALLMAAARRLVEGHKLIEAGGWTGWSPTFMLGQDVSGSTLGIVGAGRIGAAIARRGRAFNMPVRYFNRNRAPQLESALGAEYASFESLLRDSDFVVMTAPLTSDTRQMFDARAFALMKPTSVFVNVARGGVVNEQDLYHALKLGRPWAAGVDVFAVEPAPRDNPLLSLPNFVATPHIGSATARTRAQMATLAARNLIAVLTGAPALSPVNAPASAV
jgi:glyoxylate reductase